MASNKKKRRSAFEVYRESALNQAPEVPTAEERPKEDVGSAVLKPVSNQVAGEKECGAKKRKRKRIIEGGQRNKKQRTVDEETVGVQKKTKKRKLEQADDGTTTQECSKESMTSQIGDVPFSSLYDPEAYTDSRAAAFELFRLLIDPFPTEEFFKEVWEKRPMVLKRHKPHYNEGWFSCKELDTILREHHVEFTKNLDLTTYVDGRRETHNPVGRALPSLVWEHFKTGYSVRLLNPQTFSKTIWQLNSTLQELFHSGVGANTYLTPAGSQGFSPHYDDIEAFVMQLEGKKRWRVYKPRTEQDVLPRFSSENFTDSDIGEPVLDVVLEPGDLLYFPRGFIHQASTPPDAHSLHVTVSTYQRNSWSDYLEKLLPAALEVAVNEDAEFRRGLPLDYLSYTGIVHSESEDPRRAGFLETVSHLFTKLLQYAPVDAASDQMGAKYVHDCLPPRATQKEESGMIGRGGARWRDGGVVSSQVQFTAETEVKLFHPDALRLVMEKEATVVYSATQNTRQPHEMDLIGIELGEQEAPGVDFMIQSYPHFIRLDSIPMEGEVLKDQARIKKIMQLDDDVGRVASSVPVVISRAVEIFLNALLTRAGDYATSRNAKTLKHCIEQEKQWDFLKELTAKIPNISADAEEPEEPKRGRKRQGSPGRSKGPPSKRKQKGKAAGSSAAASKEGGGEGRGKKAGKTIEKEEESDSESSTPEPNTAATSRLTPSGGVAMATGDSAAASTSGQNLPGASGVLDQLSGGQKQPQLSNLSGPLSIPALIAAGTISGGGANQEDSDDDYD